MAHKVFDDYKHAQNRKFVKAHYERHKIRYKVKYLRKKYGIGKDELKEMETDEDKLNYCRLIEMREKYGIEINDCDFIDNEDATDSSPECD